MLSFFVNMLLSATSATSAQAAWGYGLFILETLFALGVIAAAGFLVVRFSKRRLGGLGQQGRLRLIERLPLEPRRSVHLIEVDGRAYLIGTSEQAVQLLTVLDNDDADKVPDERGGAR